MPSPRQPVQELSGPAQGRSPSHIGALTPSGPAAWRPASGARGRPAQPQRGVALMAPRDSSLGTSSEPDLRPPGSCWQGQADINHPPGEGTEAPSGAI